MIKYHYNFVFAFLIRIFFFFVFQYNLWIFLILGVKAVRCYDCNSHNDSRCAEEEPPEELKVDCSSKRDGAKYTMCRKIVQTIEFSVNGCEF